MAAVGVFTVTTADLGGQLTKYSIAWTASAGGAVSGATMQLKRGRLLQVKFVPTNGGTEPSNDYGVTLVDGDGVDILAGKGTSLSNTAATIIEPIVSSGGVTVIDPSQAYAPTIASAGAGGQGRIDLLIGPG
jgi:hypothetical protein